MSQNHRSIDSIFIGFTVIQTHLEAWEVWRRSFSTEHSESLVKPEHEQYQKSGGGGESHHNCHMLPGSLGSLF